MKPIKRYIPPVNPLAKALYVRASFTRNGMRRAYMRRPKFRHGIVIGYK